MPVGVSLSGGIDSSSIVAMLRRSTSGPIKTFSLGFDEPSDETGDARFVAETFGTEHHEVVLHEPALAHLGDAIRYTEEPKVNSLQLYLLHRFIGEHVHGGAVRARAATSCSPATTSTATCSARASCAAARPAPAVRALAPALDWSARRAAGLGRPQLDLATRKLEWLAASGDGARNYLLLRNAWDFNPALLRRVYTPEFAARLQRARLGTTYDGFFADDRPLESPGPAGRVRDQDGVRPAAQRGHHVDGALGGVPRARCSTSSWSGSPLAFPDDIRFGGGPKGLLKEALTGVLPGSGAAQA